MTFVRFLGMAIALAFGLALAVFLWWEATEPVRSTPWRGSAEQWITLASVGIGGCATLVAAAGALFALSKMLRQNH
jgi:hypothetical protein